MDVPVVDLSKLLGPSTLNATFTLTRDEAYEEMLELESELDEELRAIREVVAPTPIGVKPHRGDEEEDEDDDATATDDRDEESREGEEDEFEEEYEDDLGLEDDEEDEEEDDAGILDEP